ncbi:MAG: hypothetical protein QGI75_08120 [Phycisphaerales bacterium]|jgi:hypothetical protein|nr:hypothetical protein [Phycisphaerales bacterium]MDP6891181.1 hypothetical protein [Phycisphaerales bacterium]
MARDEERKRLAEVHTTDLNEGKLNEDFVTWLKTKGPTWLLIIVAFIVAYLVMIRWQQQEARARDEAWMELMTTTQPASLEDVARRHAGIDAVADLARLNAADSLLLDIQRGRTISDDGQETTALDDETRAAHLSHAQRLYNEVIADDDGLRARTLATVSALNGLAAILESQGDIAGAIDAYKRAEQRAADWIPALAQQAATRAATATALTEEVAFATAPPPPPLPAELPAGPLPPLPTPEHPAFQSSPAATTPTNAPAPPSDHPTSEPDTP